jgi:hypothetical protein
VYLGRWEESCEPATLPLSPAGVFARVPPCVHDGPLAYSAPPFSDGNQRSRYPHRPPPPPAPSPTLTHQHQRPRWIPPPPTSKTPSLVRQWKSPPRSRIRQFRLRQRRTALSWSSYRMLLLFLAPRSTRRSTSARPAPPSSATSLQHTLGLPLPSMRLGAQDFPLAARLNAEALFPKNLCYLEPPLSSATLVVDSSG